MTTSDAVGQGPAPAALEGVPATLLMTIAARTLAPHKAPKLGFRDPEAERIMALLGGNPEALCAVHTTIVAVVLRDQWCDERTRLFLARYPEAMAVNVGAGLNTNYERLRALGAAPHHWVDADIAPSLAWRRRFFRDTDERRMVEADATHPDFFDKLGWQPRQPAIFVIEGVLPYFAPAEAEGFFRALARAADARRAPVEIAFDYASPAFVARSAAHPDLKSRATRFQWGLRRPDHLQAIDPRLRVVSEFDYFTRRSVGDFLRGTWHKLQTGGEKTLACAHFVRAAD